MPALGATSAGELLLGDEVDGPGVRPPQANSVFVDPPGGVADAVRARGWRFYDFIAGAGSRLMTAWDTSDADREAFAADLRAVLAAR